MRYLVDNMFNGLVKELSKRDIDCETVIHEIWNDDDPGKKGRWDARIFHYLLEKKMAGEEYAIITADKDLNRYCLEFEIECKHIKQPKPLTRDEYKVLAATLADQLVKKT